MADAYPDDTTDKPASDKSDLLAEAKAAFTRCSDMAEDNRQAYKDDTRFVRAREQWPEDIRTQRERDGRPCLTIDKLGPVIRQVVNDARQNKPSIKVHPVDSNADPETAEVINGIIRHIEYSSNADVAYDTGVECAVGGNCGYWRVNMSHAFEDGFDLDLSIDRVANPLCIYGDPDSTAADSSDWNVAFVVEKMSRDAFKAAYPKAAQTDWSSDAWNDASVWLDDDGVMVAEYWTREQYEKTIIRLADGRIYDEKELTENEDLANAVAVGLINLADPAVKKRTTTCWRVKQAIMTGAEVLSEREWPGRYIPIVPVYGDEFWIEGKRYLRSLINGAKDAQRMLNFWRTAGTELVALAPRVPFIGPEGAFDADPDKWATINTRSWPFVEYTGIAPPQRQPLDMGTAAGAMQEALNASDDIKAITGIYDASLGARSNETSGRAIMARQREGDVSTFHFIDNMARAIRHTGRILIDLIPHVYNEARIVRIVGEDKKQTTQPINQKFPKVDPKTGQSLMQPVMGPNGPVPGPNGQPLMQPVLAMHDLTVGKYDLTVETGPSFTTQREEAAASMTELIRAYPPAASVVGPELVRQFDWPGADKIADKLEAMSGPAQIPPQVKQLIEQGKKQIGDLTQENQQLKLGQAEAIAKIQSDEKIAQEETASKERIALMQQQSQERIAALRAASQPRPIAA